MSQEVYKLTVSGETKWRCCNTNSGEISLDGLTLEPLVPSLNVAVERLLATETFTSRNERDLECQRLLTGYADISNYLDGKFVLNLDDFFAAVERITQPEVAAELKLDQDEVEYLISMAVAIRKELSHDKNWNASLPDSLNDERRGSIYSKLFPEFTPTRGVIPNLVLLEAEAVALERGLSYFDLLDNSRELAGRG